MVLRLLGGFELELEQRPIPLMMGAKRLAAFLALQGRPVTRSYVSGVLWPDKSTVRANANLRSALWRLHQACPQLIDASTQELRLMADVWVDVQAAAAAAQQLVDGSAEIREQDLGTSVRLQLSSELLPDWHEDWVLMERERFNQLRLHALEVLCERLSLRGRHGEAVDAGLAVVRGEPLRESGQRVLIRAYLAEGNRSAAVRQYERYQHMIGEELGIEPSPELRAIVPARGR